MTIRYTDIPSDVRKPFSYGGSSEEAHREAAFVDALFKRMTDAGWEIIPPNQVIAIDDRLGIVIRRLMDCLIAAGVSKEMVEGIADGRLRRRL